ncbi:MAG: cellulase family glycosylhydrolase [Myxococcota bacterium]
MSGCADDALPAENDGSDSGTSPAPTSGEADTTADSTGSDAVPEADGWLHSDRQFIRDSLDRVVILRGVNARVEGIFDVTFDDGRLPLEEVPVFTASDADQMRALGFNVLRLPLNWSGIEPEQGVYDQAYLDRVDEVVQYCAAVGIWVILDFHQDAYSKEIGEDGAPLWAIQPPPTELLGGPLGDSLEMRRFSAQVLAAFAGFFDDSDEDTADQWLQPAFADMAAQVASRFADEPWVLGYELYNEPVAADTFVWSFHERVVPVIRAVDDQHMILFEPSVTRNVIEQAPIPSSPFLDEQGVYAPHIYTFSFGDNATALANLSIDDLRPNLEGAVAEAAGWQAPLFVGEWGISPVAPNADAYVQWTYDLLDENLLHSTVWLWKENSQGSWGLFDWDEDAEDWVERPEVIAGHARPYAAAIAGEPISMRFDAETQRLELRYEGREDAVPSLIHVPAETWYPATFTIACDGETVATEADRDPVSGEVEVTCSGAGEHLVELLPA